MVVLSGTVAAGDGPVVNTYAFRDPAPVRAQRTVTPATRQGSRLALSSCTS